MSPWTEIAWLFSFCFTQITWRSIAFETINVNQTASAFPCRNGERCTNENYAEFYCYTSDSGLWETCCTNLGDCRAKPGDADIDTFCPTKIEESNEKGQNIEYEATTRCRKKPLTVTLTGRLCVKGSYCAFNKERYQWCWIDKEHKNWDYCCFPGSQCRRGPEKDGYYNHSCRACQLEPRSCGKACTIYVCEERDYDCNMKPRSRSINNYECVSPCSHDRTGYAWCWVKTNKRAWDWCCYLGETCGVVHSSDRDGNKTMCYSKKEPKWPMECKVETEATPLPDDFESPSAPLEEGAIIGISLGVGLPCAIIIWCIFKYLCSRKSK